jgi:type IV pilus assembly protein PilC
VNAAGAEVAGELSAGDLAAAREQLRSSGLLPVQLVEHEGGTATGNDAGTKKVKPKSLQIFSRQFATMIESGLNVVTALAILEEQTEGDNLSDVINELRTDVEGGMLLSEAMGRHPRVFSRLFVSIVEAGEAAGILDVVLDRVAFQIEKETQIKRKVKGAMIYPSAVLAFATLVLIGMLMFLVPVFVDLFEELGGDLPTLTKIVVAASDALKAYFHIIFPVIGGVIYGLMRYKRTEDGRRNWDRFRLGFPMGIGQVVLKVGMTRFSRTRASLIGAGVDIIKALEITGATSGNSLIEDAVVDVRDKVQQGVPIAIPLEEADVFPPMISHMVRVGEETGELEKMLGKVADFYEDEVDTSINSLTSIIEPIMMIGVIIISMYLPMFKLLTLIQ